MLEGTSFCQFSANYILLYGENDYAVWTLTTVIPREEGLLIKSTRCAEMIMRSGRIGIKIKEERVHARVRVTSQHEL